MVQVLSKRRGCRCRRWSVNVWGDFNLTFFTGLKLRLRYCVFLMKQDHRSAPENVSFVNPSMLLSFLKVLLLTCSSLLLFFSLLLSQLPLNVCFLLRFSVRTVWSEALKMGSVNVFWLVFFSLLISCISFLTASSSIGVLCRSFQLPTSSSSRIAFLSCSVPVLQLWPPLCDLYEHQWFCSPLPPLFWLSAIYLSALCLMHPYVRSAHAEDWGQTS